jgi:hypothetical protein
LFHAVQPPIRVKYSIIKIRADVNPDFETFV